MRKIHLKESIVEFRILTKKVRKARQQISEQYSPGGQTGLWKETLLRDNILLPAQPPAVRMRTSCLPELSAFIPLPNSVVAQTVCGLKLQEWILMSGSQTLKMEVTHSSCKAHVRAGDPSLLLLASVCHLPWHAQLKALVLPSPRLPRCSRAGSSGSAILL